MTVVTLQIGPNFHWHSLLSSVLPPEPEATAVGAIAAAAAMEHGMENDLAASIEQPVATTPPHMGIAVARQSRGTVRSQAMQHAGR
jgi:hypothetical protein